MEIGGAAMQRMAAAGGPGPLSLQGPPRSVKISPVNIQDEPGDLTSQKSTSSHCVGCGGRIHDQWILRVAPNLEWHAACLKCAECQQFLDEHCTCFVRDGKTYCKRDYVRLFGTKCDKCSECFSKDDYVMRAKSKIYHIKCFRCSACMRQLVPGDEFALRQDGLFCRHDHDVLEGGKLCSGPGGVPGSENNNNASLMNNNHHLHPNDGSISDSGSESGSHKAGVGGTRGSGGHKSGGGSDGKPTRVRTVLNEKQLHTLRTCYAANPRPDALMKEQLVEMTGLSPRVIRVWFQNKRCKDKKKTIAMKQQMQEKVYFVQDGRKLGFGGMHGIPMVASSPVRHESSIGMTPLEVQAYQPPWKALSDFALHTDLDRLDPNTPSFHHLVSQMHGYDLHSGPPQLPPPGMLGGPMNDGGGGGGGGPLPPPGPHHPNSGGPDMGQHPDSTDSYVTYLESDSDSLHHDTGSP
ncbi:LOW QUALITY PROTEIN: insulin gene enhancer protein ISL-1 [Osmia bicornis bicornis]|uniref:LOW QUALITY PROTEIN: insulin gene enhancer protein ISL-1 n=1 Tax=Osmia bicornis bicornis TaxID=1437191 RepID=UPI0010F570B8|nr:LOW QUALITY PROTEIN: insulin gene enhancer protein ISL-1 [Osmia bicornis bicornis]